MSAFTEPFMVNALQAGTIVAVVSGVVGWFMVLRQQAFAGHTLAVIAFPGAAGALWLGVSATAGYFAAGVAGALVIAAVPRASTARRSSGESAAIGTVQAFALACGLLFVSLYGGFLNSLTDLLFGTFLGISRAQVWTLLGVGVAVLVVVGAMSRPLYFSSVDPDVARARGVPVGLVSAAFLVVLGVSAAATSEITGALLVFALLVLPAATAQRITARPVAGVALSVAVALLSAWTGLIAAYETDYPVGFTVTSAGMVFLVVTVVADAMLACRRRRIAAA